MDILLDGNAANIYERKVKYWNVSLFSLSSTVESLENRCDDLQKHLDEAETLMRNRKEKRRSFLLLNSDAEESACSVRTAFKCFTQTHRPLFRIVN